MTQAPARELPDKEVSSVTGFTALEIRRDLGQRVGMEGRMIPLLRVSFAGWHPLPLLCDGCSWILPYLELLGTKSSV